MAEERLGRGRPKTEGPKKDRSVTFRMRESEYQRLRQYSAECGIPVTESICKAIGDLLQSKGK